MKKIWQTLGIWLFWLSWPLLWVYLRLGRRTRTIIICGDQLLLVRNWHSTGKWSLPGGGLRRGEEPKLGAVREIHEETSLKLKPDQLQFLVETRLTNKGLSYDCICYFATLDHKSNTSGRWLEINDVAWLKLDELTKLNTSEDTLSLLAEWKQRP